MDHGVGRSIQNQDGGVGPGQVVTAEQFLSEAAEIERTFGTACPSGLEVIPTGIPMLDHRLRIGGIPRGHITEVIGMPAAGKSVLTWHMLQQACFDGGTAIVMDTDKTLHPPYMRAVGVPMDQVTIVRANTIYDVTSILRLAVYSGVDMVVIDSLAAIPQASHFDIVDLGKILSITTWPGSRTSTVITNQFRTYDGRLKPMYQEVMEAIAPVCIEVQMHDSIQDGGRIAGHLASLCIPRNRFAYSSEPVSCRLIYGEGIDVLDSWIDLQIREGTILSLGSGWYEIGSVKYQGRESLRAAIRKATKESQDDSPPQP